MTTDFKIQREIIYKNMFITHFAFSRLSLFYLSPFHPNSELYFIRTAKECISFSSSIWYHHTL